LEACVFQLVPCGYAATVTGMGHEDRSELDPRRYAVTGWRACVLPAAALVLGLSAAHVLAVRTGAVVGGLLALPGLLWAVNERLGLAHCRRAADELLAALPYQVPGPLAWRAEELTNPRRRRGLARSLQRLLVAVDGSPRSWGVPVDRDAVRRNAALVAAIASRLAAIHRPVHPRAVILVEELLTDPDRSPLYARHADRELRAALVRVRSSIEPH
jgi:hypothetical protein